MKEDNSKRDIVLNTNTKHTKEQEDNITYSKYKAIALEWIKNNFNNIQAIYSKYYPDASEESLRTAPYRLLDCVRFKKALSEVYSELDVESLDIAKSVIIKLHSKMNTAKKDSDQLTAAIWLGKTKALFREAIETKDLTAYPPERRSRLFGMIQELDNQ